MKRALIRAVHISADVKCKFRNFEGSSACWGFAAAALSQLNTPLHQPSIVIARIEKLNFNFGFFASAPYRTRVRVGVA